MENKLECLAPRKKEEERLAALADHTIIQYKHFIP